LNVRSALLGLFMALTIVLASTTVYESSARNTLTSTSTSTSTLTQTTTVTISPPTSSTTRVTTSATLFSSVGDTTAFVLNSSNGLGLSIQVAHPYNASDTILYGNFTITIKESNFLNSVNNVTEANEWKYTQDSLSPCGPDPMAYPVRFAVVQGLYGQDNYNSSKALPLYNPGNLYPCGKVEVLGGPYAYGFQPLSDAFSFPSGSTQQEVGAASLTISTRGYWTGGQNNVPAAFKTFPSGYYTVIAADEWGNVVLLQFYAL
jgi:hypothetical protein